MKGTEKKPKGKKQMFLTKNELRKVVPGSFPRSTKKGKRTPLVLCLNPRARKLLLDWYFSVFHAYRDAVEALKKRDSSIEFPYGTYHPPGLDMA